MMAAEKWQTAPRGYLEQRVANFRATIQVDPLTGCHHSTMARRPDGYHHFKLSWVDKYGKAQKSTARPHLVEYFLDGVQQVEGHNTSHLCGRGHLGCVNPKHIVYESAQANLDRKDCHKMTTCPNCNTEHRVRPVCNHDPPCL